MPESPVKRKRGRPRKEDLQARKEEAAALALARCTPKQRKLVQEMAGNLTANNPRNESVGKLYNSSCDEMSYERETSKSAAKNSKNVRNALIATLEAKGVTDSLLSDVILDGLTAREDHLDATSKPERAIRHKYLDTVLRIRGDISKDAAQDGGSWEDRVTVALTQINVTQCDNRDDETIIDIPSE